MITYRSQKLALFFGLFWTAFSLIFLVVGVVGGLKNGVEVNGVLRTDAGAVLMVAGFSLIFVLVGVAITLYAWRTKMTFQHERVVLTTLLKEQSLNYSDIESLGFKSSKEVTKYFNWIIKSNGNEIKLPQLENRSGAISNFIGKIPDEKWPETIRREPTDEKISVSMKSVKTAYALFFVAALTAMIGFGFIPILISGAADDPTGTLIFSVVLLGFLALFASFLKEPILQHFTGKVTANTDELIVTMGQTETRVRWKDIVFAERFSIAGNNGSTHYVKFCTEDYTVHLPGELKDLDKLLSLASAQIPESSKVYFP